MSAVFIPCRCIFLMRYGAGPKGLENHCCCFACVCLFTEDEKPFFFNSFCVSITREPDNSSKMKSELFFNFVKRLVFGLMFRRTSTEHTKPMHVVCEHDRTVDSQEGRMVCFGCRSRRKTVTGQAHCLAAHRGVSFYRCLSTSRSFSKWGSGNSHRPPNDKSVSRKNTAVLCAAKDSQGAAENQANCFCMRWNFRQTRLAPTASA